MYSAYISLFVITVLNPQVRDTGYSKTIMWRRVILVLSVTLAYQWKEWMQLLFGYTTIKPTSSKITTSGATMTTSDVWTWVTLKKVCFGRGCQYNWTTPCDGPMVRSHNPYIPV